MRWQPLKDGEEDGERGCSMGLRYHSLGETQQIHTGFLRRRGISSLTDNQTVIKIPITKKTYILGVFLLNGFG